VVRDLEDSHSPRATGRCRGIWALKSPSHGQSVRWLRSTSATQTVPHSFAWANTLPSWPKTVVSIQWRATSS
jgi:hypothetical protein